MTNNYNTKQFAEYLVREVVRRIVPIALDATKNIECLEQAKKLRKLADDASMAEVEVACDAARTSADSHTNYYAAYGAADAAAFAAHNTDVYSSGYAAACAADAAHIAADYAAAADYVYADILIEAAKLLSSDAVPIIPDLHRKMYAAVTLPGHSLKMNTWHTCKTTHCIAGWAIVLGGESGRALEDAFGTAVAAGLIYTCNTGMVPNFYTPNNVSAMADMKLLAQAS